MTKKLKIILDKDINDSVSAHKLRIGQGNIMKKIFNILPIMVLLATLLVAVLPIGAVTLPVAVTEPATNITTNSAQINGKVSDGGGDDCQARFRYAKIFKRDNFEWGNNGDPITDSGGGIAWTKYTVGNNKAEINTSQCYKGTRSLHLYYESGSATQANFSQNASDALIIRLWVRKSDTTSINVYHGNGSRRLVVRYYTNEKLQYYNGSAYVDTGVTISVDTWALLELTNFNWAAGTFDIYHNGVLAKSAALIPSSTSSSNQVSIQSGAIGDSWIDDIEVTENWTTTGWDNNGGSYYHTNDTFLSNPSSLLSSTQYEYQVQTENSAGEGSWSSSDYFTTNAAPTASNISESSTVSSPNNVGSDVNFSGTISDPDTDDQVRLAICKTDEIAADSTCTGGAWCYDPSPTEWKAEGGVSCNYTTQAGDASSNAWYAFACDDSNACTNMTESDGTFYVNHEPVTGAATSDADTAPGKNVGQTITFTMPFTDSDSDTAKIHVCKTDAITGEVCDGGSWCDGANYGATPRTCTYTAALGDGTDNLYYVFSCDEHGFCDPTSVSGTFYTPPVSFGGVPAQWFTLPKAPEGGFRILTDNDSQYTGTPTVTLNLFGGSDTVRMAISNNPEFTGLGSTDQIAYQSSYQWDLCEGREVCKEGEYTVYAKFYTDQGTASEAVSDSIIYKEKPIEEMTREEVLTKMIEVLKQLIQLYTQLIQTLKG